MCRCLCAEWLLAAFDVKWPLNRLVAENRKEEVLYQFSPAFAWSSISQPCSFAKVIPWAAGVQQLSFMNTDIKLECPPLYRKLRFYVTLHSWTVLARYSCFPIFVSWNFSLAGKKISIQTAVSDAHPVKRLSCCRCVVAPVRKVCFSFYFF